MMMLMLLLQQMLCSSTKPSLWMNKKDQHYFLKETREINTAILDVVFLGELFKKKNIYLHLYSVQRYDSFTPLWNPRTNYSIAILTSRSILLNVPDELLN